MTLTETDRPAPAAPPDERPDERPTERLSGSSPEPTSPPPAVPADTAAATPTGADLPALTPRQRRGTRTAPTVGRVLRLAFTGDAEVEYGDGADTVVVTGVGCDSRRLKPGDLFIALPGVTSASRDGHEFLDRARAAGAAAALVDRVPENAPLPWARVADTRKAAGPVADVFHRCPSDRLHLVGVTGTNGKTTVAWLLDAAFRRLHGKSLFAGTVGHRFHGGPLRRRAGEPRLTTWEAPDFHDFLARAERAGCRHGAVECSSHGLALDRLGGVRFEAAVFTNLTLDHGDFHQDFEDYYRAKRLLFTDLLADDGVALVSADDPHGRRLEGELRRQRPDLRVVSWGRAEAAEVRITEAASGLDGTKLLLRTPGGSLGLRSPLVGKFNAANLAAAWAVLESLGTPAKEAAEALAEAPPPPGRMEPVPLPITAPDRGATEAEGAPRVIVDYAHTPDALERALEAARDLAGGRPLTVVFGCGGERDREKRFLMGETAARLADRVVLTADNPRGEDPAAILADIETGAAQPGMEWEARLEIRPRRRRAIRHAVASAEPGEVVLVAGRGHETHQIVGGKRRPLSDRKEAEAALRERAAGPADPSAEPSADPSAAPPTGSPADPPTGSPAGSP